MVAQYLNIHPNCISHVLIFFSVHEIGQMNLKHSLIYNSLVFNFILKLNSMYLVCHST